ncbi:MAG TPA: hypothetical protein VLG50_08265 [Candidatus Saccharimonadales bacterium]|nr:hypothetical protein [Candidatus Saccharimonadales bacterium]
MDRLFNWLMLKCCICCLKVDVDPPKPTDDSITPHIIPRRQPIYHYQSC